MPEPFGSGHINDTFKFSVEKDSKKTDFILQKINHHIFKNPLAIMENVQKVAEHLTKTNYSGKILKPVLTKQNQPLFFSSSDYLSSSDFPSLDELSRKINPKKSKTYSKSSSDGKSLDDMASPGEYWRVFPFFENTFSVDKVETETQAFEAARAFGEYLNYLKDIDLNQIKITILDFHNGVLRVKKFKSVLKTAPEKRLSEAAAEIRFVLENQSLFEKIDRLNLPLRITHNDTKINNILFEKQTQKAVAVIDLDTLMPGIVLSDFGDMVRTFTSLAEEDEADLSKVGMRKNIYRALKEGFLAEMTDLTKTEKNNLFEGAKWITLMQALRFLTDFLEGDVYYKTKYASHNLVRTRNQIVLFKSMKL